MSKKKSKVSKTSSDPTIKQLISNPQSDSSIIDNHKAHISDSESSTDSFQFSKRFKSNQRGQTDSAQQEYDNLMDVERNISKNNGNSKDDIPRFKRMLVSHIENRILNSQKQFEEAIHEELECFERRVNLMLTNLRDDNYYQENLIKEEDSGKQQMEKTFKYKPSLLSQMFKQSDYKTLYNMIVASLFAMMVNILATDYVNNNILFDIDTFLWCFKNIYVVVQACILIVTWGFMSIPMVICYKNDNYSAITAGLIYALLQFCQMAFPCYLSLTMDLGFGTQMILLCEGARMCLKNHSYIRNKILYGTKNTISSHIPSSFQNRGLTLKLSILPEISIGSYQQEFKRYAYFMLAPTLIYRDTYVKAPHRSIKTVIIELANFLLCIYYGFILFKSFMKQPMLELRDNLTYSGFLFGVLKLMMPSTFALILIFFGLLHSWMNAWAEALRFPDRTFYLDWWTSQEFGQYYRKWNIIVHEFLFYYVYVDIQRLSRGKVSKGVAQIITFMISAVLHEIILGFAIGFFYPICFLMFTGPGVLLIRQGQKIRIRAWVNIVFWALMYLGTSLMITLYLVEYYARHIVSDTFMWNQWGVLSYVVPRTFYLR